MTSTGWTGNCDGEQIEHQIVPNKREKMSDRQKGDTNLFADLVVVHDDIGVKKSVVVVERAIVNPESWRDEAAPEVEVEIRKEVEMPQ